jgi:membrane protein implicated in regulation of membrane protease activity
MNLLGRKWGGVLTKKYTFTHGINIMLKNPLQGKGKTSTENEVLVDSMVGEIATVLEALAPQALGKVEHRGSTWNARNAGTDVLEKDTIAKIVRVDGLTLWIQAETHTQEEHHVG